MPASGRRDRLPGRSYDESVAFNTRGDTQARLEDIGAARVEAMDAAGIDVAILSVVTPATQALPAPEAVALAREANDQAADAVRAFPARLRARPLGSTGPMLGRSSSSWTPFRTTPRGRKSPPATPKPCSV